MNPTPTPAPNSVMQVMDKLPETVSKTIDVLAQKFGSTGAYLWEAYVRYMAAWGVSYIVAGIAFCAFGMWLIHNHRTIRKHLIEDLGDDTGAEMFAVFGTIAVLISLGVGVLLVANGLPMLLAPAGSAFDSLVHWGK